jgi:transcription antitermination factor NusA-like protein
VQLAYALINQNIAATAAPGEHTNLKVAPTTPAGATFTGDQHTVKLLIPGSQAGGLIGKGGQMINAIRMQSGAHVKVANKDETGNHVGNRDTRGKYS